MLPDVAVCRAGLYLWWRLTLPLGLRGRPNCCRVWRASGSVSLRGMLSWHVTSPFFPISYAPPERSYASVFACRESDAWLLTSGGLFMRIRGA